MKKVCIAVLLTLLFSGCDNAEKRLMTLEITDTVGLMKQITICCDDGELVKQTIETNPVLPYTYQREFDDYISFSVDTFRMPGPAATIVLSIDGEVRKTWTTSCYSYHVEATLH